MVTGEAFRQANRRGRLVRDLGKLRQEGGSGIAKLHKIIRHDMKRTSHQITLEVTQDGEFQVFVDFGGSILHEDPPR